MTTSAPRTASAPAAARTLSPIERLKHDPAYQAFWALRVGFFLVPVLFGLDKFAHVMTDWDKYLAPWFQDTFSPFDTIHQSMYAVGIIEIFAGVVVLLAPRIGAYVVALWLAGIIWNLLLIGGYGDVAFRDFALLLAALTLGRLAMAYPAGVVWDRTVAAVRRH